MISGLPRAHCSAVLERRKLHPSGWVQNGHSVTGTTVSGRLYQVPERERMRTRRTHNISSGHLRASYLPHNSLQSYYSSVYTSLLESSKAFGVTKVVLAQLNSVTLELKIQLVGKLFLEPQTRLKVLSCHLMAQSTSQFGCKTFSLSFVRTHMLHYPVNGNYQVVGEFQIDTERRTIWRWSETLDWKWSVTGDIRGCWDIANTVRLSIFLCLNQ